MKKILVSFTVVKSRCSCGNPSDYERWEEEPLEKLPNLLRGIWKRLGSRVEIDNLKCETHFDDEE